MSTATMSSKGQITIPVKVRLALGLEVGSRVEFLETEAGMYAMIPASRSIKELKGLLSRPPKKVSIKEMNQAIAEQGGGIE